MPVMCPALCLRLGAEQRPEFTQILSSQLSGKTGTEYVYLEPKHAIVQSYTHVPNYKEKQGND